MNLTQAAKETVQVEQRAVERAKGGVPDSLGYIKAYYKIRTMVGLAGWTLPFILVIGGWIVERSWTTQGSLSAYYHTGMSDFFVSVLSAVGILLVAYRLSDKAPDNGLGTWAGATAIGVVFFPTARDLDKQPDADLTAMQSLFGERPVQVVHFICAIAFILCLAQICLFFAELEREGKQDTGSRSWYQLHRRAAQVIYAAIAFVIVFQALNYAHNESIITLGNGNSFLQFLKDYSILLGEAVAVFAFGVSWFIKGLDRESLRADSANAVEPKEDLDGVMVPGTAR